MSITIQIYFLFFCTLIHLGAKASYSDFNVFVLRRPYDIFQVAEREFEENDAIFKEILKLVRLIMYFLMFVAILGGAVTNKLSLMLLISGINKVTFTLIIRKHLLTELN